MTSSQGVEKRRDVITALMHAKAFTSNHSLTLSQLENRQISITQHLDLHVHVGTNLDKQLMCTIGYHCTQ
jgi:hypothetical protein